MSEVVEAEERTEAPEAPVEEAQPEPAKAGAKLTAYIVFMGDEDEDSGGKIWADVQTVEARSQREAKQRAVEQNARLQEIVERHGELELAAVPAQSWKPERVRVRRSYSWG